MIHAGALSNLALQKFKAGTISIWQRGGKWLTLGGIWCRARAAPLASRCPAQREWHRQATPTRTVAPCLMHQPRKKSNPTMNRRRGEDRGKALLETWASTAPTPLPGDLGP